MIDIHSHVLPMVDDGASSVEQALSMLVQAYEDGTDGIVLTPHFAYEYGFNNPNDKVKELYADLKYIVRKEGIPIQIYLGCEFLFSSVDAFEKRCHEITRINDTQYLLMEFFFDVDGDDILKAIDCVIEKGLIPVIAHPERYECIQISIDIVEKGILKGALFQMNKGSVFGDYGRMARETVFELLDRHYIHFVGSDGHNTKTRNTYMYETYQCIKDIYGRQYAKNIFIKYPQNMLKNKDIRNMLLREEINDG